jgi:hypothetical protein
MPKASNNLSAIGFNVSDAESFIQLLQDTAKDAEEVEIEAQGSYKRFETPEGAQMWLQLSPDGEVCGGQPHFKGTSRYKVKVIKPFPENHFDGRFLCETVEGDTAGVPFAFDSPDFQVHPYTFRMGAECTVQLTAFPREIDFHKDIEAFREASAAVLPPEMVEKHTEEWGEPPVLLDPDGGMIPSGTFTPGPEGGPIDPPQPIVIYCGKVYDIKRNTNSTSGNDFYSMTLKTLGGSVDLIAEPSLVPDDIEDGYIVYGDFYVTGLFIEKPQLPDDAKELLMKKMLEAFEQAQAKKKKKKKGFFGRLFGKR